MVALKEKEKASQLDIEKAGETVSRLVDWKDCC